MFKDSVTIGRIFNIPIRLHFSFLLVIPILAVIFRNNLQLIAQHIGISPDNLQINPFLLGLIMALALFLSVLLHELAHSFVAKRKGMKIKGITLMLLGGVAQIEEISKKPGEEAVMALSGPLLSIGLGFLLLLTVNITGIFGGDILLILTYLGQINIFLGVFNLLPAFPTDGGRILRSLLSMRMPFVKATRLAVFFGRTFALLFGLIGLAFGNFILIFIAFFIYIAASQEYQSALIKTTLSGFAVSDLMTQDVTVINEDMPVSKLIEKMFKERHSGYPVLSEQKLKGCVTMEDIQKLPPEEYNEKKVGDIMSREIKKVNPDDDIHQALNILSREDIGRLMVIEGEKLVGIITRSDIMKGFRLRQLQVNE